MSNLIQRISFIIRHKAFMPIAVAAAIITMGSVATVSAAPADNQASARPGYAFDQCKNGGWRNFTNPDGSQKFRNQGQCIAFFVTEGQVNPNPSPGLPGFIAGIIGAIINFFRNLFMGILGFLT